jgi:hypothetical protein
MVTARIASKAAGRVGTVSVGSIPTSRPFSIREQRKKTMFGRAIDMDEYNFTAGNFNFYRVPLKRAVLNFFKEHAPEAKVERVCCYGEDRVTIHYVGTLPDTFKRDPFTGLTSI